MTWAEHDFDGEVFAASADGDRFVAVGRAGDQRFAWTATDGATWQEHVVPGPSTAHCDDQEPVCIERSAQMGPMARLQDTLYSFGATEFFNDYIKAVGWRWTDGQNWQVIESQNPIYAGGAFRAVAASDSAIFAVTHAGYPFTERHWLWRPDTSWVPIGEPISTENPIEFRSVAWREGPGLFLAVGGAWNASDDVPYWEWDDVPAAWSSTDGDRWVPLATPQDASALCGVVSATDYFLVVGLDGQGTVTIWRSADGVEWAQGSLPGAPRPEPSGELKCQNVNTSLVSFAGGAYLALAAIDDHTLTWTSSDGIAWRSDAPLDMRVGSVAAIDRTVVAFGSRRPHGGEATQGWAVGTLVTPP